MNPVGLTGFSFLMCRVDRFSCVGMKSLKQAVTNASSRKRLGIIGASWVFVLSAQRLPDIAGWFMAVPDRVVELVERFQENEAAYRASSYKEAHIRQDFLDPFFECLGWDLRNTQGIPEAYKEVIFEDAIKVRGSTKAPDYCFRVGGNRKFFVEAKKPSVNLEESISAAFQVRRYGWSAKLPISILTDFEELAVYDCRIVPDKTDKATTARLQYLTYEQYADYWQDIYDLFSREAVLAGSLDQYAETSKKKRGAETVDAAFLREIEGWREKLAIDLSIQNPDLTQRQLNFAVQMTINRLIFLRISEDRGIEPYEQLKGITNTSGVYEKLCGLFRRADDRYNSGLFHFKPEKGRDEPDEFTLSLAIGDEPLTRIIRHLYYPDSPYEFSVIPIEILGQVYEQFLGKVIRLDESHQAIVEDKPEVRKAGGVYYTPTYIVDYIVENTVGKLLEAKTPKQAEKLTILDPACGSGSFLIGAYQYLLDWYLAKYAAEPTKRGHTSKIYQAANGEYRLTSDEKKKILLNNIYGIDIDLQAVETTKLSLLLKVLEGESDETLAQQMTLFQERALPDLSNNIRCGNSLIGTDYYESFQLSILDEETVYRINVFDWDEGFPSIMSNGGFDVIIGNPPWGAEFENEDLIYLREKNRPIIVRMIDSFMFFVFQTLNRMKPSGKFGMILPDVIFYQVDNFRLREYIIKNYNIEFALNMGNVFYGVVRPSCILIADGGKKKRDNPIRVLDLSSTEKESVKVSTIRNTNSFQQFKQEDILEIPQMLIVTSNLSDYYLLSKITKIECPRLIDLVDEHGIQRGVSPDLKDAFMVSSEIIKDRSLEEDKLRRVISGGRHIKRYRIEYPDLHLIYTSRNDNFSTLPNICAYIDNFQDQITCKEVKQGKHPLYALHRPRKEEIFLKKTKILGVITEDEVIVAKDTSQVFATDGCYLFALKDESHTDFVIGILNSRLFVFLYRLLALEKGRVLAQVKPRILDTLPVISPEKTRSENKDDYEKVINSVENLSTLYESFSEARTSQERKTKEQQIKVANIQHDRIIYKLYGLSKAEVSIVERNT